MNRVQLKFEALGLPAGRASLQVVRLPSLEPLPAVDKAALPDLGEAEGYYFPSALIDPGAVQKLETKIRLPPAPAGFFWLERGRFPRYFCDLTQSYEDFLATKSAKSRSTLKRKLRKLKRDSGGKIKWNK